MERSEIRPTAGPQVIFRGLIPLENLVSLAHEQDALLRAVLPCAALEETEVCLEQQSGYAGGPVRAEVQARVFGDVARGYAQHRDPEWATKLAFSELMRELSGYAGKAARQQESERLGAATSVMNS